MHSESIPLLLGLDSMSFGLFLSPNDVARLGHVLHRLRHYGLTQFAITGSLALETSLILRGNPTCHRELNDLDIVVESFDSIPNGLANSGLLVRHIHPRAPEGKIVIQFVDPDDALRIDVFRSYGATLRRSKTVPFGTREIAVVSLEDLTARAASLMLGLQIGSAVPLKHAEDFQRLVHATTPDEVESVWPEHRQQGAPLTFKEAATLIRELVQSRRDLIVTPHYSQDVNAVCPSCVEVESFRLAPPLQIMSILGYC